MTHNGNRLVTVLNSFVNLLSKDEVAEIVDVDELLLDAAAKAGLRTFVEVHESLDLQVLVIIPVRD